MTTFPKIKSLEPIKHEDYLKLLEQRSLALAQRSPIAAAQTVARESDDGRLVISKATGGLANLAHAVNADGSAVKSLDPAAAEQLATARGFKWGDGMEARVKEYWASDERVDRHGDIVRQFWDLGDFAQNPLMLYAHDWHLPPVGGILREAVVRRVDPNAGGKPGYAGPALLLAALFSLGAWDWADTVFNLVDGGFLKAGSVGFWPGSILRVTDAAERQRLGLGEWGVIYGSEDMPNALVEWTVASVPANPGAHLASLQQLQAAKRLKAGDVQVVRDLARGSIRRGRGDSKLWAERDASIVTAWKSMFPDMPVPAHLGLDEPILTQAVQESDGDQPATRAELEAAVVRMTGEVASLKQVVEDVRTLLEEKSTEPAPSPKPAAQSPLDKLLAAASAAAKNASESIDKKSPPPTA